MLIQLGVGIFVFREEPEADGNLRAIEELAREGGHVVLRFAHDMLDGFALKKCAIAQGGVYEVGLDEGAADVAFTRLKPSQKSLYGMRGNRVALGGHWQLKLSSLFVRGEPLQRTL